MQIKILGTGAAEGFPGLFCECPICSRARKAGGKNIRSRACVKIDEDILIDLPPDILQQSHRAGFSLASIQHLLITHGHRDHFTPSELHWRDEPFAHWDQQPPLHIYGNTYVGELLRDSFNDELTDHNIHFHTIRPFVPFTFGTDSVTPIEANHLPEHGALNYILTRQNRNLLLAFDTGWYGDRSWSALDGWELDLVLMECTNGLHHDPASEHLSVEAVKNMRAELLKRGCLRDDTRFITLHFSHNGGLLHEDLEERFLNTGIEVGYDGLMLESSD
ncbi:MAG: MBL fold metallo-hydrolase [bacterium]